MGRTRCFARSRSQAPVESRSLPREWSPEMGSQSSFTPKRYMSSRASQKEGMANPRKTKTVSPLSRRVFRRTAARMPMGTARPNSMTRAMILSDRVTGIRSLILSMTGRLSGAKERPKSSCAIALEPEAVLDVERLVETVELPQPLAGLGGDLGAHGGLHLHRLAGGQVDHREGDQGDPEQEREEHQNSFQEVRTGTGPSIDSSFMQERTRNHHSPPRSRGISPFTVNLTPCASHCTYLCSSFGTYHLMKL